MKEAFEFLYSLRNQGSKFGIERMEVLCGKLNNPHLAFPTIHVAGTNGKGSVCSMLDSIYRRAGYKVGLFTSPHLVELGERIRVNGRILPFQEIKNWVDQLISISHQMENEDKELRPTFFELMTAIAFMEFEKQKVDIAIIETGLGGRLDSTNVLSPLVSVITSIGYDHCEILGTELSQIAYEKAGIIKSGRPVVVGWLPKEASQVVLSIARQKKSPVYSLEDECLDNFPPTNLSGFFQHQNAAIACKTARLLNSFVPVRKENMEDALLSVSCPGRWDLVSEHPQVILDACHNEHGADANLELWDSLPKHTEVWFAACGIDRAKEVLSPLLRRFKKFTFFTLQQPRSCDKEDFKEIVDHFHFWGSVKFATEEDIPNLHQKLESHSSLLVTGSLYLIASYFQKLQRNGDRKIFTNWQDHW